MLILDMSTLGLGEDVKYITGTVELYEHYIIQNTTQSCIYVLKPLCNRKCDHQHDQDAGDCLLLGFGSLIGSLTN